MPEKSFGDLTNAEQWVVTNLQRWIATGVLPAEIEISQQDLAKRLGVSRSPVRDALRRLESLGLITIKGNQRAVVTGLTTERMLEIFEMRAVLEGLAALHAVPRLTETDLIELDGMARVMGRLKDPEAYAAKHDAFHEMIAKASAMPRLRRDLAGLRALGAPYIRIHANAGGTAELAGNRHEDLVEVLASGDGRRAEEIFRNHVHAAFEQLKPVVARLLAGAPGGAAATGAQPADRAGPAPGETRRTRT